MSSRNVYVEDGVLCIDDRSISFPHPVGEVIGVDEFLIVRLEPPVGTIFNRNVFAVTKDGRPVWQIVESPHGTELDKPYVGIHRDRDGGLVAANWNGVDYLVDVATGGITTKAFNK